MLERHKLLMGRTQDRAGQNNGSIGVFWRSFNGIIGHIRYMFRGPKITHNHEHSSLYTDEVLIVLRLRWVCQRITSHETYLCVTNIAIYHIIVRACVRYFVHTVHV